MIEFRALRGKVALVRFPEHVELPDVEAFVAEVRAHLTHLGGGAVYCVDCEKTGLFPPRVADALIALMKSDNPAIARTGVLVNGSATFGMQVERMLREADNPCRRSFRDAEELLSWLCEATDADGADDLRSALR